MNEFTIEDLETIKDIMDNLFFSKFYNEKTQLVYQKINLMLKNHCEHLWMDGSGNTVVCGMCHLISHKR